MAAYEMFRLENHPTMRGFLSNGAKKPEWPKDYLLGRLSEEARTAVDQKVFADRDAFEELLAAEDDLVDDYVRGRLSKTDRIAFDKVYSTTKARIEKVDLAQALLQQTNAESAAARRFSWFGRWRYLPVAAALLLCAGAVSWVWWPRNTRAPLVGSRVEEAHQKPSGALAVLVLEPGLLRDSASREPLRVPKDAGEIEMRAYLEVEGFGLAEAQLKTPEGKVIWTGENLRVDSKHLVTMRIPAYRVESGDYLLSIQGGREKVEAGEYSFRIARE
jgi:hypothetical protein